MSRCSSLQNRMQTVTEIIIDVIEKVHQFSCQYNSIFQYLTNIHDPHISKSLAIHSSIDEEAIGSHGNRSGTFPWAGGGAFNGRTHPLKGGAFSDLKRIHIVQIPIT